MTRKMTFNWHLRQLMAGRGMFQTSDLVPKLAERGVHLSREQVYRLVTSPPQRLNMEVFVALCDILGCTPNDLIEPVAAVQQNRRDAAVGEAGNAGIGDLRPVLARVVKPATPDGDSN
ncbi:MULTISPECIES: helix-turn-helix transcriptional regulator [unclassified Streptomyces]|uniref:helix-turn-helix domain-containing protein n=2 Tax=unclassified Streptomyces TaxID=2593676 RepID=UPI0022524546|nr:MULTISPECIES: helix-turn-helix transcriptional regulator [unclassified Streptomyces]MCX5054770.1 helix-turn-helix transcriptional regulator [Streptomyces sp. NBC_00474]